MHDIHDLIDTVDPRPTSGSSIKTSLSLRPQDHRALGQLALDTGIKQQSLVRRALVLAGVITLTCEEAEGA